MHKLTSLTYNNQIFRNTSTSCLHASSCNVNLKQLLSYGLSPVHPFLFTENEKLELKEQSNLTVNAIKRCQQIKTLS